MGVRIGIDAGSKTIKVVILDDEGNVLRSAYRRHLANIGSTLSAVLRRMIEEEGDAHGAVAFTGSAGIALAQALGAPHIQEVVAVTDAVRAAHPQADGIIELGGEDAKIVYLSGGLEQRMNAVCAGGTGGFIDTMAGMLGVRASDMNRLASKARRTYPIASRCVVFAQTDVRPLINSGADPQDVAASVLDAVVRQTLGGLACGRPLKGTIVFLGGPLEHIPALVDRFRSELDLDESTGIKPRNAHLYTAWGAALAAITSGFTCSLSDLARACESLQLRDDDLPRLAPLFDDEREIRAFKRRHSTLKWPRARLERSAGPLFVGFDAGSTTVKVAILDERGSLVHSEYRPAKGDALTIASAMLARIWQTLPDGAFIARSAVTGYGEDLLIAGLRVDEGVVETIAHAEAAMRLHPDVSFVLDIGGQDMKALWLRDGRVVDSLLNEACSSGCGAFLEGTSYALGSTPDALAASALRAESPIDLGTRCTVFMTSRVRHAQKIGADLSDIGAGLAYSVVSNVFDRIIGPRRASCLGECVMVQGGAFRSDAVLRAFELRSGCEALRPDVSHLMGAIGAALVAQRRWCALPADSQGERPQSGLIDAASLRSLDPRRRSTTCSGCSNACLLSIVDFGDGRISVSGNRCARGTDAMKASERDSQGEGRSRIAQEGRIRRAPDVVRLQQKLLMRIGNQDGEGSGSPRIGLVTALSGYESLPFWQAFFRALGFGVITAPRSVGETVDPRALESVVSESVCYTAKQANAQLFDLAGSNVDAAFMPRFERGSRCPVLCDYAGTLVAGGEGVSCAGVPLISPLLTSPHPVGGAPERRDVDALLDALGVFLPCGRSISEEDIRHAWRAGNDAQRTFEDAIVEGTSGVLRWLDGDVSRRAVVLACRPYHIAPEALHGVNETLSRLGIAVIPPLGARALVSCGDYGAIASTGDARAATDELWPGSKRLVRLAAAAASHPRVFAVFLRSFGCTMDAVALQDACAVMEGAGKPYAVLKVDDIVDRSHVGIRLRTFAETLSQDRYGVPSIQHALAAASRELDAIRTVGELSCVDIMDEPLDRVDFEIARRDVPADACLTASLVAARLIRRMRDCSVSPETMRYRVPEVCHRCVLDAVGGLAKRACGTLPSIEWTSRWPRKPGFGALSGGGGPRVGIVGNALLCLEESIGGTVASVLAECGCEPVLPELELLFGEDATYAGQLQRWYGEGVRDVVYLLGFGCLKGHVSVRARARDLLLRFPGMRMTIVDYDQEASKLNRENRLRLAAHAALEAWRERPRIYEASEGSSDLHRHA